MDWHSADGVARILVGDCLQRLRDLPDCSVQCCVTSPPYWGLRDYGNDAQLGLESTPEKYVENMVAVFREVRRVLRSDGTLWLNLGDSYAAHPGQRKVTDKPGEKQATSAGSIGAPSRHADGLKPKDLVGIPWRVAFALQQPYYAGSIRDERDRIWLAAMLDAEGCMFIHKRKAGQSNGQGYERQSDNYAPGVEIANTSLAIIERIHRLVGKGSICSQSPDQNNRRKQTIYRWNLRTTECREFVRELYPHLVGKQQQARILCGCPSSGERAEAAHTALISLHRTGISDVDFPAPATMFEKGYYLRQDIVWSKLNPMPESVRDRCTKAHEYVFLLTKSERYYYDSDAIKEPCSEATHERAKYRWKRAQNGGGSKESMQGHNYDNDFGDMTVDLEKGRNKRSVWKVSTKPYKGAHFATMPPDLVEPCILAGTSEAGCCESCGEPLVRQTSRTKLKRERPNAYTKRTGEDGTGNSCANDVAGVAVETTGWLPSCECNAGVIPCIVLDPFGGSGTTVAVAAKLGRRGVCCELNPEYVKLAIERITPNLPSSKHPLLKG